MQPPNSLPFLLFLFAKRRPEPVLTDGRKGNALRRRPGHLALEHELPYVRALEGQRLLRAEPVRKGVVQTNEKPAGEGHLRQHHAAASRETACRGAFNKLKVRAGETVGWSLRDFMLSRCCPRRSTAVGIALRLRLRWQWRCLRPAAREGEGPKTPHPASACYGVSQTQ